MPLDRDGDLVEALAKLLEGRGRGELVFPADDGGLLSPDFAKARDKAKGVPALG